MAAEKGFGKSANGVGIGDRTEFLKFGSHATAAKLLPGTAVEIDDASDYCIKEFDGTGAAMGTLGYEDCEAPWKPKNRDTAYAGTETSVPVEMGPSRRRLRLAKSQTIAKGDPLKFVADGLVSAASVGTDDVCADADESVTTDASTISPIWANMRR